MNFSNNKKIFLYEVDPLFFYDSNGDGFGDFKGFLEKIDYFNFLGIDGILLPDMFNQESVILKRLQISVYDKYGKIDELKEIIKRIKDLKKSLIVEINIKNILSSTIIKKNAKDLKTQTIEDFIEEEITTKKKELKWNTEKKIEALRKIINFWSSVGINNYVFSNLDEFCLNNKDIEKIFEQLKFIYSFTKENNSSSLIGIRTMFLSDTVINRIFSNEINNVCDFLIDSSYSLIGTKKRFEFDLIKKFNHKKVLRKIKKIKISSEYKNRYFVSFNNNRIGRVNSRWLNESNLIDESNKSLLLLSNYIPYSSINYYGDELGLLRLKIENKNEYYDYEYNERKRKIESNKLQVSDFENSQKLLSRINSQSVFIWNNGLNGGFSTNSNIFRKLPINYKEYNFENESKNDDSIVNFYRKIIKLNKNIENKLNSSKVDDEGKIKIKLRGKLFTISFSINDEEQLVLINLSNKTINKKVTKKWEVILSSIANKNYSKGIQILCPFESLILNKKNQ